MGSILDEINLCARCRNGPRQGLRSYCRQCNAERTRLFRARETPEKRANRLAKMRTYNKLYYPVKKVTGVSRRIGGPYPNVFEGTRLIKPKRYSDKDDKKV